MQKQAPVSRKSGRGADTALPVPVLLDLAQGWILDSEIADRSPRTLEERRGIVSKLGWFLNERSFETCDVNELRAFLAYVKNGHTDPAGRWGNPAMTRPVGRRTQQAYHQNLTTLYR